MLKILAFLSIFPAIFFPRLFIATGILIIVSVTLNYFKWYLVYNYNYVVDKGYLLIKKTYKFIKPKIIANLPLEHIKAKIIYEYDIEGMDNVTKCYNDQSHFKVFILVTHQDRHYALVADNYFYSLISKEEK